MKKAKSERDRTRRRKEARELQKKSGGADRGPSSRGTVIAGIVVVALLIGGVAFSKRQQASSALPVQTFVLVNTYVHDDEAFTQGLLIHDGVLFESTGKFGKSSVRRVELETGRVLAATALPPERFGEGLAKVGDRLVQLTWKGGRAYVYDVATLNRIDEIRYATNQDIPWEGWGLTYDGTHLVATDGSDRLRFLDPKTLVENHQVRVTAKGIPITNLNELEWVKGEIWANIWRANRIARIDPKTGHVKAWIDLTKLNPKLGDQDAVLNGIAYDPKTDQIWITGKWWPYLYEIRIKP